MGVARSMRSDWAQAAAAYRHAVACDPDDLMGWHRLGVALAESGEEAAAATAFERALVMSRETEDALRPDSPLPRSPDDHLTELGTQAGELEAKTWLDLALKLLSMGEEEESVAAYERAYTLNPERASHSLFKPMLRLLAAASETSPLDDDEVRLPKGPSGPRPRDPRRSEVG